jgi:TolB-like protein/Tfp pilus assembly protein PilF
MPFVNVGGDTNTEYLSDGLSESLINSLARLPNLKVVPRNMAFRYKGKDVDPQKIGKDLNVRSILMGRVFQRGDILNVQTELVDVLKVSQLWGDQYNRKLADIQVVQEEIAAEISDRLRLRLTGAEQKLLTKRYTENPEAYQLYLKGRYYWNRKTEEAFNRGIQCFKQAIDKDPGFALAWAGLADCYNNLGSLGYLAPRDVFPKAKEAATKALELDENLAEAHTSLAVAAMCYGWNWQEAEKEFRRAVKLSPDYATAHSWYGIFLDSMGRFDEGLPELNRARELEPLSLAINTNIGNVHYYFARQYEQAARQLAATLEMDPNFALAHHGLGAVYLAKPILGDALAESQKAAALEKSNPRHLGLLGMAYVAAGKKDEAAKILDELQELSKRRYIPPTSAANILARMAGRRDEAFQELERGYEDRSWIMYQLKVNPIFDPLRTDARFQGLLRRMNFPEK